ncbi:MAG: TilS substrate-binding domain-containing protein, partial [Actinomycetota bacterium]|nr:TilS substrate-binding domain-containing protein [Actinomycetota bacterium]
LPRATTEQACRAEDIAVWHDPHNEDPAFARVRVRRRVLPVLEAELGPGVPEALSRTGRLLRDDADALAALAAVAHEDCRTAGDLLSTDRLGEMLPAVRRRVLRRAALEAGCPATDLTAGHVAAVDDLVTRWRGQQRVDLPGAVRAVRDRGTLRLDRSAVAG